MVCSHGKKLIPHYFGTTTIWGGRVCAGTRDAQNKGTACAANTGMFHQAFEEAGYAPEGE